MARGKGPPHVMHQMAGRTFPMLLVMSQMIARWLREDYATRSITNADAGQRTEQYGDVKALLDQRQQANYMKLLCNGALSQVCCCEDIQYTLYGNN